MHDRKWDVENLSLIFNPDLFSLITSIPLSLSVVSNSVGWGAMGRPSYMRLMCIRSLWVGWIMLKSVASIGFGELRSAPE